MTPCVLADEAPLTHAVILAAGLGSRLSPATIARPRPKCLTPVAGRPILARLLDDLHALGVRRATIVVGWLDDTVRRYALAWRRDRIDPPELRFVVNERYAHTGSVHSLHLGLQAIDDRREREHVLVAEGDVVLERDLLRRLLCTGGDAATLLAPYDARLSGSFANVERGVVTAWLHETARPGDCVLDGRYKTVNLTLLRRGRPRALLLARVAGVVAESGAKAPLEFAMQDLVAGGLRIQAVSTDAARWFEIDTPQDLRIAESLFAPTAATAAIAA